MAQYRKKPVVIDAFRYDGHNEMELMAWIGPEYRYAHTHPDGFKIYTLEGDMIASPGDWVIRGMKGELYPCNPDIFEATYEPA